MEKQVTFRNQPTTHLESIGLGLPSPVARFLEFIGARPGQPYWRTELDDVPTELLNWDAIEFCDKKDWVRFESDLTFSITPEGYRVLDEHVLRTRMEQKETCVNVQEVLGQPKKSPALEVKRIVGGKKIDTAKICGPALVSLFQVVQDLSASAPAGDFPKWEEIQKAFMERRGWKGHIITTKTLRDYARRIRKALVEGNQGGLWHQTSEGARWQ